MKAIQQNSDIIDLSDCIRNMLRASDIFEIV